MTTRTSVFLVALVVVPALASAEARGPEFAVNTWTTGNQAYPAIASDGSGNFVVVWQSYSTDWHHRGIFARRYAASGAALDANEFRVNTYSEGTETRPAVAVDAGGRFVVVWQSFGQDGSHYGILARRFDAAGAPLGDEFVVNTYTTGVQRSPKVASDASGNFVVVWSSQGQDGDSEGVFGQRYDESGVAQGGEFAVNESTTGSQGTPGVASDSAGNFVVTWVAAGQDGPASTGIIGRRFDRSGTPVSGEFRIDSYTTGFHSSPAVSADPGGRFVVAWTNGAGDGSSDGVFAQRFDATGAPAGSEFRVNSYTTDIQQKPAVASDGDGHFVVSWTSYGQDGSKWGVFGQRFDAGGLAEDGEFPVNTYTTGFQGPPAIAAARGGSFVVVWPSLDQDGSQYGVFGQRFASDLIFKDGFETGTLAAWSATAGTATDLSVSPDAALDGTTEGLRVVVDDTNGVYVEDDRPQDEDRYRARFYFDPNGYDPGESQSHFRTRIFVAFEENPLRRLAAVVLKRQGGAYWLLGRCRLDDGSQADTGLVPITDAPHVVEIDWARSTAPSAHDGHFEMWVDGTSVGSRTGLDDAISAVDLARIGALSVKGGATGTMFFDEFESRRASYIGP